MPERCPWDGPQNGSQVFVTMEVGRTAAPAFGPRGWRPHFDLRTKFPCQHNRYVRLMDATKGVPIFGSLAVSTSSLSCGESWQIMHSTPDQQWQRTAQGVSQPSGFLFMSQTPSFGLLMPHVPLHPVEGASTTSSPALARDHVRKRGPRRSKAKLPHKV